MIDRITELVKHETAGDPMTDLKWTHKTTAKIAEELRTLGVDISPNTVARLLKQTGYSLRVNHEKLARVGKTTPEDRDAQFTHIAEIREDCAASGRPLISIDTKKKELVGPFKNAGAAWSREPVEVLDHDFPSDAIGKAIPYGIYDVEANRGTVFVGTSRDTAQVAVDAIEARIDSLPEETLRRVLAFRLTDGTDEPPDWFIHLVRQRPALVAEILSLYAGATLKAGQDFINSIGPIGA